MHRWVWDLHYAEPVSTQHEFPISAVRHDTPRLPLGPLALPGQYTVRLKIGEKTLTAPLIIRADPRVDTPMGDLHRQFDMQMKLASMLSDSSMAVMEARSVHEQLQKLTQADSSAAGSLKASDRKLTALLEGIEQSTVAGSPTLVKANETIFGLYGSNGSASAAPTVAQENAASEAANDFNAVMKSWNNFKASELPQINAALRKAGQPEIHPENKNRMEDSAPHEE